MKTGNKIALFYTAITIGIISMVTVVFYFVATDYISRLYYSYLTEKAYATAQKHWEKDELDEEDYARIQQHYEETLPVAAEILLNADSIAEAHSVLSRYLTDEKIASLYAGNVVRFHEGKELGAAVYYPDNEGNFIVLVVSSNQYGGVWDGYPASDRLAVAGDAGDQCRPGLFRRPFVCDPHGRPYRCGLPE